MVERMQIIINSLPVDQQQAVAQLSFSFLLLLVVFFFFQHCAEIASFFIIPLFTRVGCCLPASFLQMSSKNPAIVQVGGDALRHMNEAFLCHGFLEKSHASNKRAKKIISQVFHLEFYQYTKYINQT